MQVSSGVWEGVNATERISDSPQWLLHVKRAVQLVVVLTQDEPDGEELVPLWLALYKLGEAQNDPKKRARLLKARRLRVAAGAVWSPSHEVTLQIPQLDVTESESAPYVLVAAAIAEGKQRKFEIRVCAREIVSQTEYQEQRWGGLKPDVLEMSRWTGVPAVPHNWVQKVILCPFPTAARFTALIAACAGE